ncbi:MAG: S1 RNA-binding domain-containing protein [Synechococcales bacterium]|nr:S1 RNA-binding domain-containing protein [Synechococcales bacterium]
MSQPNSKHPSTAAFSMEDFEQALNQHGYEFARGQVVRGKAFSYENDGALIDIGGKSPAFLPITEASLYKNNDITTLVPLQEEREFVIIKDQNEEGQVTVSIRRLEEKRVWVRLADMQKSRESFAVRVVEANRGGVAVNAMGIKGFVPRSHLIERVEDLSSLIGTSLSVTVLELERSKRKIVLSNRLAARAATLSQYEMGQLVSGQVASLKPFGVFVDLEGCVGLLHVSQISQKRVEDLEKLFQPGQEIKTLIVNIDEGQNRISLSTKVLENFPGEVLENLQQVMDEAESRQERARKQLMA